MVNRVIDVSSNNGSVDWDAVKASGIVGALTKRSESTNYADPTFQANWDALGRLGMARGAYHFSRPETDSASADADYFLSLLPSFVTGDILALDIETGAFSQGEWAYEWLQHVEQRVGFKPWLYTGAYHLETYLQDQRLAAYPLWLASYVNQRPTDITPPNNIWPWSHATLWQWSQSTGVPGIGGNVDESATLLSPAGLRLLGKPAAAPPPAPKTHPGSVKHACSLKPNASHSSKALVSIPAGGKVLVTSTTQQVGGELWERVGYGSKGQFYWGFVLSSNIA